MKHKNKKRDAFTLIELLIVMSILATLMGMLMPLMTIANRAAKKSASQSVMVKIDTALRLFRAEIGSYPWQKSDPDVLVNANWSNRLYYHLGTNISLTDMGKLYADAGTAEAQYKYIVGDDHSFSRLTENAGQGASWGSQAFLIGDTKFAAVDWTGAVTVNVAGTGIGVPRLLNQMAAERGRLAIFAGNVDVTGCKISPVRNPKTQAVLFVNRDFSAVKLVASPSSGPPLGKAGWAHAYLRGELEKRYVAGETILDAWGRPIIYIGQVVEGVTSTVAYYDKENVSGINARLYGLQTLGRKTLGPVDALTGDVIVADPLYCPSPNTNPMNSDRRKYAAPSFEPEFELWSAGADGRAQWMRDNKENSDNVSLLPYDKRIVPW